MKSLVLRKPIVPFFLAALSVLHSCKIARPAKDVPTSELTAAATSAEPALLIPEIQNLPSGGEVPSSVYARYDSRTIGENIAYRIHKNYEEGKAPAPFAVPIDIMNSTSITLRFHAALISAIFASGFLNQHQTGTSRGSLSPDWRANAETVLSDLRLEGGYNPTISSPVHHVRPKYSWMSIYSGASVGAKSMDASQYGEIIAVLKEEVKLRSTFTFTDSLSPAKAENYAGTKRRAMQSTFYGDSVAHSSGYYLEAQIWGELDISDIAYFAVLGGTSAGVINQLASSGLPIKEYQVKNLNGRMQFEAIRELRPGDAVKMTKLQQKLDNSRIADGRPIRAAVASAPPTGPPGVTSSTVGGVPLVIGASVASAIAFAAEKAAAEAEAAAKSSPIAPSVTEKFAGKTFRTSEMITFASGESYQVLDLLHEGDHTRIYKVKKSSDGGEFVLKIPIDTSPHNIDEITKEITRVKIMKEIGLHHAFIVEAGAEHIIKPYLSGLRADIWLHQWEKEGFPDAPNQIRSMTELIEKSSAAKKYIGDLNPKNVVWDSYNWVIIDSGDIITTADATTAMVKYLDKMEDRWGRRLSSTGKETGCKALFGTIRARIGF